MEKGGEWDMYCAAIAFAYRTSPHPATGESPYRVVYGVDPVLPIDRQFLGETNNLPASLLDRLLYLKRIRNGVFEQLHRWVDHEKVDIQSSRLLPGDLALVQLTIGSEAV
ncbi:gag-pol polyprotein [Cystoisospora suis]|uniref:Gag-pol polyprotein n=1 Tax=Cystoisospora suis TaxID=483139 RepID=A0A2C6KHM5_9APIC|nr:gag-pol polyprotein [Cystoisospora suis]